MRARLEIVDDERSYEFHRSGYHVHADARIGIYVRATDLTNAFPAFSLETPYRVRATLIYSIGFGRPGGRWSDTFIEAHFPESERLATLVKTVRFADTDFQPYEPIAR